MLKSPLVLGMTVVTADLARPEGPGGPDAEGACILVFFPQPLVLRTHVCPCRTPPAGTFHPTQNRPWLHLVPPSRCSRGGGGLPGGPRWPGARFMAGATHVRPCRSVM